VKTISIKLYLVDLVFDSGKNEIRTLTRQQLAGLKKSKIRKTILSKKMLAVIDIKIKHQKQIL
jgi:hypothetical protein